MKIEIPEDLCALADACDDFGMMPYWVEASRASVMRFLAELCPNRDALRWLVRQVVNHVDKWPGPAEIRGILCTRYDPADGIDGYSTCPGFRPEDAEIRYRMREAESYAALPAPSEALARLTAPDWVNPPDGINLQPFTATSGARRLPALRRFPTSQIELRPTPVNDYERNLLREEANDDRLSPEARDRARRILERLEVPG